MVRTYLRLSTFSVGGYARERGEPGTWHTLQKNEQHFKVLSGKQLLVFEWSNLVNPQDGHYKRGKVEIPFDSIRRLNLLSQSDCSTIVLLELRKQPRVFQGDQYWDIHKKKRGGCAWSPGSPVPELLQAIHKFRFYVALVANSKSKVERELKQLLCDPTYVSLSPSFNTSSIPSDMAKQTFQALTAQQPASSSSTSSTSSVVVNNSCSTSSTARLTSSRNNKNSSVEDKSFLKKRPLPLGDSNSARRVLKHVTEKPRKLFVTSVGDKGMDDSAKENKPHAINIQVHRVDESGRGMARQQQMSRTNSSAASSCCSNTSGTKSTKTSVVPAAGSRTPLNSKKETSISAESPARQDRSSFAACSPGDGIFSTVSPLRFDASPIVNCRTGVLPSPVSPMAFQPGGADIDFFSSSQVQLGDFLSQTTTPGHSSQSRQTQQQPNQSRRGWVSPERRKGRPANPLEELSNHPLRKKGPLDTSHLSSPEARNYLSAMDVKKLRMQLEFRDLRKKGKKNELIERIIIHDKMMKGISSSMEEFYESSSRRTKNTTSKTSLRESEDFVRYRLDAACPDQVSSFRTNDLSQQQQQQNHLVQHLHHQGMVESGTFACCDPSNRLENNNDGKQEASQRPLPSQSEGNNTLGYKASCSNVLACTPSHSGERLKLHTPLRTPLSTRSSGLKDDLSSEFDFDLHLSGHALTPFFAGLSSPLQGFKGVLRDSPIGKDSPINSANDRLTGKSSSASSASSSTLNSGENKATASFEDDMPDIIPDKNKLTF